MNDSREQKDRKATLVALLSTLLFSMLAVAVLLLCGMYRPFPPPPEYGVEVNLGYMDDGSGDRQAYDPASVPAASQPQAVEAEEEEVVTAQTEEAQALPKVEKKPVAEKKPEPVREQPKTEEVQEVKKEPEINPLALYPGKRKGTETSSEGETGKIGDQGKPTGDANAHGYTGSGGSGGISFSLNGRTLMSLVKPDYDSEEEGVVVVRIWVNKNGMVTRVQAGVKGTTTLDGNLWKMAEKAARLSQFVPKDDAPEEQVGTITYRFVRGA